MPSMTDYIDYTKIAASVTITSGTDSSAVDLGGGELVALEVPASLSSTAITFTTCDTATGTFVPVADKDNATFTLTVSTAAKRLAIPPTNALAFGRYVKIICGSSESNKTFKLITKVLK